MVESKPARAARYVARNALHKITTVDRCYDCGWTPNGTGVAMRRTSEGVVGYAGLVSCGRVWLCPVCNAKIMARRAIEIGAVLTWASQQGYQVIWGSLTLRHNAASDLGELLHMERAAWRHVVQSKGWWSFNATTTVDHVHDTVCSAADLDPCTRKKETILLPIDGRIGYIRAAEVTIGRNGWHPHFHPILFVRGSRELAQELADLVVDLWVHGVEKAGGEARHLGGQHLEVLDPAGIYKSLGGYVTKATYDPAQLALETVWSQGKTGNGRAHSTASHWTLLAGIVAATGEVSEDLERWWELEDASKGHRMIAWSRGLRAFAGLGVEVEDEELAAEEVGTREDTVCFLTSDGWASIRDNPGLLTLMLDTLELAGWAGLRLVLDAEGVEYYTLEPASL